MPSPSTVTGARRVLIRDAAAPSLSRPSDAAGNGGGAGQIPTSEYFGINTLGHRQMRDKLPKDVYNKLKAAIRHGKKLDREIAPVVAQVIKDWAISRGVTHFTHWFQPMTGLTAEKHDAFLSFDEAGRPLEAFTAEQLVQSEPDASSFPSGGLRATWEARGYTAWNPASPVFIMEAGGTHTLFVPSVFVGYTGEALDEVTPLLRSGDALSERAIALLELLGDKGVHRVYPNVGPEQEFFLIDRGLYAARPDLVMARRTLIGAPPARGQQLEDHYFAGIPERVQACIAEVERELYKLGVPVITRHNEVAPSQYEMAPRFEEADLATDHNQLMMAALRNVSMRHGFHALLHEKPFAGVNGSGKHCNWSLSILADAPDLDGVNLLKPGNTPHQNLRFLLFLAAVLQGVHKHAPLLRAAIGSAGNEHRLGANEAPPAIISAFVGTMLSHMIEDIIEGKTSPDNAGQAMLALGVDKLPDIEKDNTDRNRTSPFAFTGNKFEFRAVGSSQSIAFPIMILNAAVAEALGDLTEELRAELGGSKAKKDVENAVLKVVRKSFKASTPIRFEGNNYAEEWVKEAAKRKLPNLRRTPDALAQLRSDDARELLTRLEILSADELESRYHVRMERYIKDMLIEIHALRELVDTFVLPAAYTYAGELAQSAAAAKAAGIRVVPQVQAAERVGEMIQELEKRRGELVSLLETAEGMHESVEKCSALLTGKGAEAMQAVRACCDAIEVNVPDALWPLPKYREMLFPV